MPKNNHLKDSPLLIEGAWEVCNQVGGIYTVIKSKILNVLSSFGDDNYCLIGPYINSNVSAIFEPISDEGNDLVSRTVRSLRARGYEVNYGRWLVSGRPRVVLFNPYNEAWKLTDIKKSNWESHNIPSFDGDDLFDQTIMLASQITDFFQELHDQNQHQQKVIAHMHEWMAGIPIPEIRRRNLDIKCVFTTHATLLGRYLAMNDPGFYDNLEKGIYDWEKEATHFNILPQVAIERAAAHGAHTFTTVSRLTAIECKYLLGRDTDAIVPNGINVNRFEALHESQNLHQVYKEKIHEFVMGHFFQSYSFDLDNTLYFFTSGRYEFKNKGFDLTLEALARLNHKLRVNNINKTVVTFFITKKEYNSINPLELESRAVLGEIRKICDAMERSVGERLFYMASKGDTYSTPSIEDLIPESLRLQLRRTVQSWKTDRLPFLTTHNLQDDSKDDILNFARSSGLLNFEGDRVKLVYHPDFVSSMNPLFGIDYDDFVRGCHLGVFPSYYEPWGYTPMECVARGIPAVTSDLAGFGDFVINDLKRTRVEGIEVIHRKHSDYSHSAEELANFMYDFVTTERRDRISQRSAVEQSSIHFDWDALYDYYIKAYQISLER
ncbi:glycosyltransferase [Flammeovirga sp. EKP202]|uniref:glycosyltransferase n=1 Tax=Flammeovirga sp. EKP202 TaxID=2770592 RepID=UPI00165FB68F|nr:glycosyltransferase [Flammeovirga sp. EKP202]MBD0402675.1 glycogen synthase [Flammeovirga sp. EKP202]